nr:CU044_2847 family protein [Pseudanabaena sp. SR411]
MFEKSLFSINFFANIDKVTLKFGIKIAGEAGILYITKSSVESNLETTVECSFPKKAG